MCLGLTQQNIQLLSVSKQLKFFYNGLFCNKGYKFSKGSFCLLIQIYCYLLFFNIDFFNFEF
jgi:hypothetical protein